MTTNNSPKPSEVDPLVNWPGNSPKLDDPFLQKIATMPGAQVREFLTATVERTPAALLAHPNLAELLIRNGHAAFRFESLGVTLISMTCGVAEIHIAIDFVLSGHFPGNQAPKRTISGEATAIFMPGERIVFDVNLVAVNRPSHSA